MRCDDYGVYLLLRWGIIDPSILQLVTRGFLSGSMNAGLSLTSSSPVSQHARYQVQPGSAQVTNTPMLTGPVMQPMHNRPLLIEWTAGGMMQPNTVLSPTPRVQPPLFTQPTGSEIVHQALSPHAVTFTTSR